MILNDPEWPFIVFKFQFSSKNVCNNSELIFSNRHNFFSSTFFNKRFIVLDTEKAELSENEGFVALRCFALWKNSLFWLKKWFSIKIYGFWKKILAQNVIKIIFRTFPGTHRVFNCRIKELANFNKLNLCIVLTFSNVKRVSKTNSFQKQCQNLCHLCYIQTRRIVRQDSFH